MNIVEKYVPLMEQADHCVTWWWGDGRALWAESTSG